VALVALLLAFVVLVGAPAGPAAAADRPTGTSAGRTTVFGRALDRFAAGGRAVTRSRMGDPSAPLRFGIYPWGGVGAVDAVAGARPDVPERSMAAVQALRGSRSFVVHLYGEYTGTDDGAIDRLVSDARWWSENGIQVEMVLRFRPARASLAAGFVPWVRAATTRLAALPGTVAVQIGNEANADGAPAASDGAYAGAITAIAKGVPAARAAADAAGRPGIAIGLNWAAGSAPCTTEPFWGALRAAGGRAFTRAVDWVGVDVYPGTWSAPSRTVPPTGVAVAATVTSTLRCLRRRHLPAAGLGSKVTLTVAETGYPTAVGRSEAAQAAVLRSVVGAVQRVKVAYGVTDLRWFSLRDANTGSGQMENGYGLLRDDYAAKPAYDAYRAIIGANAR
jgi:hypothetical protein